MIRSAGILMPITSLPSEYGVGTLGKEARKFADFLAAAGQTWWQILPTGPTGFGDSPYQPLSSYAGNPYMIDLEELIEDGLLTKEECDGVRWFKKEDAVDYGALYNNRYKILRLAANRLPQKHPEEYIRFLEQEHHWLKDYAVFMAIKNDRKGEAWQKWPQELRDHNSPKVREEAERLRDDVLFYERIQYFFFKQMKQLKEYVNAKGIKLIGDLPFYMAADSIDVWANPEQFLMDHDNKVQWVAGMPADGGNPDGQKWGNPLFNWNLMRNEGYRWWIARAAYQLRYVDVLRIDHFKGFESYYAVPADAPDARGGHFEKGPGLELFRTLENALGKKEMILEDLGILTDAFKQMVKDSGYPGMRILQYAFDPNDPGSWYMPFQYIQNSVVYFGTHDNSTLTGWLKNKDNKARADRARTYLGLSAKDDLAKGLLRAMYASVSDVAIVQTQDLLGLDDTCRTNDPAGKTPNWTWRMKKGALTGELAEELREMMLLYCRNNWNAKV